MTRSFIIAFALSLLMGSVHAQETRMADIPVSSIAKITVERRGEIVLIGINRPDIQNRLDREAGWGNAMRYILTGDHWTAQEAYRMGTVQEVPSTPQQALDRAIDIANKIAANGPLGIKASLASAHLSIDAAQVNALSELDAQRAALYRSKDFQEGRKAEAEERPPVYQGH